MARYNLSVALIVIALCYTLATEEETTFSKFKYDKQMLETMVRLEAKMNQLDRERKAFEESVLSVLVYRKEEMERKFMEQKERINSMLEDYREVREEFSNKSSQLEMIAGHIEAMPRIAFNAYTMSGGSYDVNKTVIFPNVLLNEGGGYDKDTGTFKAPVAGLYLFSVHICSDSAKYTVAAIVHNDVEIAITTEFENSGSSCGSVMAPVLMEKDGCVHVKSTYTSTMLADSIYRWPSFTGVLINI